MPLVNHKQRRLSLEQALGPPLGKIPMGSQVIRGVCALCRGVGQSFYEGLLFMGSREFQDRGKSLAEGSHLWGPGLRNTSTCPESEARTPWPLSQDLMGHLEGVKQGPSDFSLVFLAPTSPVGFSPQTLGEGCYRPSHPVRPCLAARFPGGWVGRFSGPQVGQECFLCACSGPSCLLSGSLPVSPTLLRGS